MMIFDIDTIIMMIMAVGNPAYLKRKENMKLESFLRSLKIAPTLNPIFVTSTTMKKIITKLRLGR